ncbi:type III-B CRISPR module RAMP protein Cmr6 [Saccharopolyspora sp. NPDC000359]|uniref:type III-B CRISPR module RAMP protein Cmr6 n=1 Tax=Saccharopolyspora sp. NPDC000359 TaxID=3154251 RepID=UPI00331CD315
MPVYTRLPASAHARGRADGVDQYLPVKCPRGGPNPALVFTGMWVGNRSNGGTLTPDPDGQLKHLKQVVATSAELDDAMLPAVHQRRLAAARALAERSGRVAQEVVIKPMWRVVVGHGGDDNYEIGLTFSRTYGVPIWPASGLKGLAAAQAADPDDPADTETMVRLFGSPRPVDPDQDAEQGGVVVLDALPMTKPDLVVDVLTPHQVQYYKEVNDPHKEVETQPAEYHSPVPVRFLAVGTTSFSTVLIGNTTDVTDFRKYLEEGLDDRGLGGKTAAGYGYCEVKNLS